MLAFAHSDIDNAVLHTIGDAAVMITMIAIGVCLFAIVTKAYRERSKGSATFLALALVFAALSFLNGESLAVFVIASVLAFVFSLTTIAHLFRPMNFALPKGLQAN
jgi:uncharacterized membrane protein YqjE